MRREDRIKNFGKTMGFITMFLLSTLAVYLSLRWTNRFPSDWTYWYIFLPAISITLIGALIKILLK